MNDVNADRSTSESPRGTFAIVGVFGMLVVVGWLWFFFGLFEPRLSP
jgi:hypothetical protein